METPQKKFNIALFGYPGCGKTTIAQKMQGCFGQYEIISSGKILRKHIRDRTALGVEIEEKMNSGDIISSRLIISALVSYLQNLHNANPSCFYLFDGCPRTIEEADMLLKHVSIDAVFYLDVPRDTVVHRLQHRYIHEASGRTYSDEYEPPKVPGLDDVTHEKLTQRIDDQPHAVSTRLSVFENKTLPLLDYYRDYGILHTFSSTSSDIIFPQIVDVLSNLLGNAQSEL